MTWRILMRYSLILSEFPKASDYLSKPPIKCNDSPNRAELRLSKLIRTFSEFKTFSKSNPNDIWYQITRTGVTDSTYRPTEMALPGLGPFSSSLSGSSSLEDPNKKIRKPYTITKCRESWTEPEHDKFLEAIQLFDRDWKKIEAFVGSKTVIQIRSHAQKYFLKVQKSNVNEHLPPPRPKRKAAHPYPQKASKHVPMLLQHSGSFQMSSALVEAGYVLRPESSSMPMNPITTPPASSQKNNFQTVNLSNQIKVPAAANICCSSNKSTPRTKAAGEAIEQENHGHQLRVLLDFAQVYGFIGSVFDPDVTGHVQRLKRMDPIDVETVLLLMRNLSVNLSSPDFEDHRRLLSSYEIDTKMVCPSNNMPHNGHSSCVA